jgi:Ribosomal L38e protein family
VPRELKSKEEFEKLLESATEVRIVEHGDNVKVKLRTKSALYTFKTTSEEADALVKGTKVPIIELG